MFPGRFGALTGRRFDEKLGDSPENRETVGSCTLTPYHDPSDLGS